MPTALVLCIDGASSINVTQGRVRATHLVPICTSCEKRFQNNSCLGGGRKPSLRSTYPAHGRVTRSPSSDATAEAQARGPAHGRKRGERSLRPGLPWVPRLHVGFRERG